MVNRTGPATSRFSSRRIVAAACALRLPLLIRLRNSEHWLPRRSDMWLPGRVIVGVVVLVLSISCLAWETWATQDDHVMISISNGVIVGERRGHYYAFEGLPYAKPPTGDRRFAPPELNDEQWDEPRNATALGAYCMQWSHTIPGKDKLFGEEDCLYLNVYTTALGPAENTLSTLVYIHGGAFMFGGGGFFSPTHVLQKPMIVVTFNYRLGPLGFLSTEDDVIPGNFGLKDQVTALQWVRKNIHHFGGDPGRVTLVGFSAGGASVHLHYLSPMSRGLFQNGIAHSGTALNPWVMAEDSAHKAKRIAQSLGCPTDRSQTLLTCLRERPAADIVRQVPFLLEYLYNPFTPLGVVVEKQSKLNRKPFLADHPATLSRKGKLTKVPLILSVAQGEGLYPGAEFVSKPGYLQDIDAHWYELLPSILDYKSAVPDGTERDQLSRAISEHYFGKERKLTRDNFRDFISILSNRLFFVGATRATKLLQPHIPVYFYYYNFKAAYGIGELMSGSLENYGVAHGDDTLLIFPSSIRDEHPYTDAELRVVANFVTLYDTFSRGLEPMYGPDALPVQNITGKLQFLEVKAPPPCGANCGGVRVAYGVGDEQFWESLDFHDDPTVLDPASKAVHTEL